VNRDAGRLVEDDEVLVLEQDRDFHAVERLTVGGPRRKRGG
jgi:hypothetical protein